MTPKRAWLRFALAALPFLFFAGLVGCEFLARVKGSVRSSADVARRPVAGATVTVRDCPPGGPPPTTTSTGEQGTFNGITSTRRYHRSCIFEVSRPGFVAVTKVLGDVCGETPKDEPAEYCPVSTVLDIPLEPLPGGASSATGAGADSSRSDAGV